MVLPIQVHTARVWQRTRDGCHGILHWSRAFVSAYDESRDCDRRASFGLNGMRRFSLSFVVAPEMPIWQVSQFTRLF
jgi:hypothetical protein